MKEISSGAQKWEGEKCIIRGGLDIVTDKTKKKNRRQIKKPPSLRLRGLTS